MADVFISYKHNERARCERIAAMLRALGLDVWFDAKLESGQPLDEEIEKFVTKSKAVLVLWSAQSATSRYVRAEAKRGLDDGKLVAARMDDSKPPMPFDNVLYDDLFDAEFTGDDPGWRRIVERISKLTNRPAIVACNQALADAARPLKAWSAQNPKDPWAKAIAEKAEALGRLDTEKQAERKSSAGPAIAAAGLVFLALGAAGGYAGARFLPGKNEVLMTAELAVATAQSVAASIVGKWDNLGALSEAPACGETEHEMEIWLGRAGDEILVTNMFRRELTSDRSLSAGYQSVESLSPEGVLSTNGDFGAVDYTLLPGDATHAAKLTVEESGGVASFFGACP